MNAAMIAPRSRQDRTAFSCDFRWLSVKIARSHFYNRRHVCEEQFQFPTNRGKENKKYINTPTSLSSRKKVRFCDLGVYVHEINEKATAHATAIMRIFCHKIAKTSAGGVA